MYVAKNSSEVWYSTKRMTVGCRSKAIGRLTTVITDDRFWFILLTFDYHEKSFFKPIGAK